MRFSSLASDSIDESLANKPGVHSMALVGMAAYLGPLVNRDQERDYVNFYFIGNWTNYVKSSNARLVERLKRLSPYANIIIFADIQVLKNPGGQDIILVLVDNIDV